MLHNWIVWAAVIFIANTAALVGVGLWLDERAPAPAAPGPARPAWTPYDQRADWVNEPRPGLIDQTEREIAKVTRLAEERIGRLDP